MSGDDALAIRADLVGRLRCAEGHLHSVVGMIEADAGCAEVLRQILAVQGALRQVSRRLVKHSIDRCLHADLQAADPLMQERALGHMVTLYAIVSGRKRRLHRRGNYDDSHQTA